MKPGGSTCARVGSATKGRGFGETRRKHLCRSQSGHRNPWRMFETSHVVSGHNKRKGFIEKPKRNLAEHPFLRPGRCQQAAKRGGWFRGTPFRSPLQGGLKGLGARGGGGGRRSEGRRGLHLRKASRGLQRGLKGA